MAFISANSSLAVISSCYSILLVVSQKLRVDKDLDLREVIVGFLINQGKMLGILEERTKHIGDSLYNLGKDFKEHLSNHR